MTEIIKYKGKEYPISVSYYCLKKTRQEMGIEEKDMNQIVSKGDEASMNVEIYESMLYYSLIAGAEAEETEMDLPRDKMEFVLDSCFNEFIEIVKKAFPNDEMVEQGKKPMPEGNRQQRRTGKTIVKKPQTPGK